MTTWTNVGKPVNASVVSANNAIPVGLLIAITQEVTSVSVTSGWGNIAKSTSSTWSTTAKPTSSVWTLVSKPS